MKCKENFRRVIVLLVIHCACATFTWKKPANKNLKFNPEKVSTWKRSEGAEAEVEHHRAKRQTTCFPPITCDSAATYRTITGVCNNLKYVYRGSSITPFARFQPAVLGVGGTPRGTGGNLPRARLVSAGMVSTVTSSNVVSDKITLMVMQFGQMCDHDLVFTPEDNVTNSCSSTHASAFPINVAGDSFFAQHGVNCLPFVRSRVSPCASGREQINELTSYLDASNIYGSTQTELTNLRVASSYLMKFGPGKEVASCAATNPDVSCRSFLPVRTNANGNDEFFAGDRRAEEQPGLTSLHTVLVRMHNDIATQLKNLNTACTNEIIFQETRKIIGAVMQKITYGEFLPIVIGPDLMNYFWLNLGTSSYQGYDQEHDASARNVFATASFRFGHSLIKDFFTLITTSVDLSKSFNNHGVTIQSNSFPSHFMRGISVDPSEAMDQKIVDAVHNKLFASANVNFAHGEDLYARNIQRGRDHGIPGYTTWLQYTNDLGCWSALGIPALSNLQFYETFVPTVARSKLGQLYSSLDDVDLFPVSIAEINVPNGLLGPTFACLNAHQFYLLKHGDRYWFENGRFNANQLASIKATKLSDILCRYTDATTLQADVFQPTSTSNPNQACSTRVGVMKEITKYWSGLCPTG